MIRRSIFALTLALAGVGTTSLVAEAQYFGRNRVQYEDFNFQVLETEHFDIYHYEAEAEAAEIAARMAERWYARLSQLIGHQLRGRQPIILYASQPHFQQTNALTSAPGEGTGGVTEVFKRRIILPFAGPLAETDHVLGHELVHAFQFDLTGERGPISAGRIPSALRFPLWFIEGMAEYLSVGPVDPQTAMWMREAAQQELPTIRQLDDPRYFPYRYGHSLWAYIAGRWGDAAVGGILRTAGKRGDWVQAIRQTLQISLDSLSNDWHRAIRGVAEPIAERTQGPEAYGSALFEAKKGQRLNIAPALSPDGSRIVFFSERSLFSVELFLADAETGRILRKITETVTDPHFESLLFIQSAGAWGPEGRRFAFPGIVKGQPILSVVDVETGERLRDVRFRELGEILNPAWSPDGRSIVFSAIVGGLSDLYIYDLETDRLRRLTDDPFADLQPAWSPDGSRIAFVTDRFSSRLDHLSTGHYGLALIDPESGRIESLPGPSGAKSINPQWSPDGRSLYFVSDLNGIPNVYRLGLGDNSIRQITNLFTGVSGITPLSPAISVASRSGRLVFTAYANRGYGLYRVDDSAVLVGEGPAAPLARVSPAVLPPRERGEGDVYTLLASAETGLPAGEDFERTDYSAGLSLDFIGQPTLVVGADRFGTFVGGGASLFWSDMLGNHNLATMAQVSGDIQDFAGLVAYQNLSNRLNWGAVAQRIPFVQGAVAQNLEGPGGQFLVEQRLIFRQINHQAAGLLSYPFSRVQRLEFQGGFQNISFDQELDSLVVDRATGQRIVDKTVDLPSPDALNFGFGSAALVYDNSFFGATGPLLGQRYRLELGGNVGSLTYYSGLADYRRYFMPVRPFTLAARILHFGRYGGDAEDDRLFPLFLGYQSLMRGYNSASFEPAECNSTQVGACPEFERLFGSRLAVANVELRFPILGLLGIGSGYYGFLPLEMALFGDAGVAWTRGEDPEFFGGGREIVRSVGAALRFNLFGYAILELDYVKPFDRPNKDWYFQFGFTPGF